MKVKVHGGVKSIPTKTKEESRKENDRKDEQKELIFSSNDEEYQEVSEGGESLTNEQARLRRHSGRTG